MKKRIFSICFCMLLILPAFSITTVANEPPYAPMIEGPTYGKTGTEYNYTFSTIDPDGDDVYYYIHWGDGNYEEWIGPYASGEQVTVSHTWEEPGTYTIQAKAKDIHGAESDWSELEVKMVGNNGNPPSAPTIDGPTNGHPGIEYNYTFASCDPEGDDVYYLIDWGDGTVEDWSGPYPSCQIVKKSHGWSEPGTYFIRAKARDINGTESDWSDPFEVVIVNEPPNTPTINGQTSGKTGIEYEYTFNATDADGDDVKYYIEWGDVTTTETDYNASGTEVMVKHTWDEDGNYTITAKAEDIHGVQGPEGTLTVNIPRDRATTYLWYQWFLERFPLLEKLLSLIRVI